ncbi:BNR-4 repeat-containing protein [Sphingobacterium haloxyli]|uniref:Exo-alpha-sialidase n=1 Tax=Sphingobacterium haloxyli TaxID=2100533 RepID=A0A2S9J5N8_9SPHI|nr:BNR-4 repeat-containing protein [Sphingobacterium haloxyli]PRD48118.1 hypothetical protein C5745_06295 [Sphingobacterium haloxyli]
MNRAVFVPTVLVLVFLNLFAKAQFQADDYEVVAEDAAWCWFSDPRAVYHKGLNERIYYAYINSKGDVVISARYLESKEVETFVLHKELQVDDHNVPSILFLPDGRLITFYTEHNGRFFMRTSKKAENITEWEEERVIPFGGKRITYSHPVMLKEEGNRIYMFWRGSDWRPSFSFSDDLGDSWSPAEALIESKGVKNRPYLKVHSNGKDRIDFIFTDGHPAVEPTNSVYHFYYKEGIFHQTSGEQLSALNGSAIQHERVHKVYDGEKSSIRAWISDVALDKNGTPVVVYTRFPQDTDHRYHYAQWNGKRWLDEEICKGGGSMPVVKPGEKVREPHYSGGIALDHHDPSNVYLSRKVDRFFEVEHWKRKGKRWIHTKITSGSGIDNIRPYAVFSFTGDPIVLWMTGTYNHYTQFDTDLRINQTMSTRLERVYN